MRIKELATHEFFQPPSPTDGLALDEFLCDYRFRFSGACNIPGREQRDISHFNSVANFCDHMITKIKKAVFELRRYERILRVYDLPFLCNTEYCKEIDTFDMYVSSAKNLILEHDVDAPAKKVVPTIIGALIVDLEARI